MMTLLEFLVTVYALGFVVLLSYACWSLWGYANRMLPHEWLLIPALCLFWPWMVLVALWKRWKQ